MSKNFYLTTPLYYVNSKPHIGHAYTQVAADVLARYHRLIGEDVKFLTGTDEHGQKVEKAAKDAGMQPQAFTDQMSGTFRDLWKTLNIEGFEFIRTTEGRHVKAVQEVWKALYAKKEIYQSTYSGWYCTPDESFWNEGQVLREGNQTLCPDCKRPLEKIEEENYFFSLSKHQDWLVKEIRTGEHMKILPETRKNEVLGFLENNKLQDLCISRPKSRLSWGIPSPISDAHVTYVWFDALINYITACGYGSEKGTGSAWPADVHLIGKDILRHHAVYWPILLKALDLPLPKMIFAHGWWVVDGEKMSNSRGNVPDPRAIIAAYGVDAFRYFLLSETPFGGDGTFSEEALIVRCNADLANGLGNLLSRTLTMCEKYFEGQIPEGNPFIPFLKDKSLEQILTNPIFAIHLNPIANASGQLRGRVNTLANDIKLPVESLAFSDALMNIWRLVNEANTYIEKTAPWKLAKENQKDELRLVIVTLMEVLKVLSQAIWSFMPTKAEMIWTQLGLSGKPCDSLFNEKMWGFFEKGGKIAKGPSLFPRIETEKNDPK